MIEHVDLSSGGGSSELPEAPSRSGHILLSEKKFGVEEVLPFITSRVKGAGFQPHPEFHVFEGFRVDMTSLRYKVFQESIFCATCQLKGRYFLLEANAGAKERAPDKGHMNLYSTGTRADGTRGPILMTKDHILPKSLGGKDNLSNLRTMCQPCNSFRGNRVWF